MPKETPENPAPDETTAPPEASPPEAPEVEAAEDNNADAEAQPQSDTAALQAEVDALNDKLLRSMADYQNLARRSQINVQQAREQALSDLAKAMIKALDHFDLALQVDPEKTNARSVLDGVTMVRDELLRTLGQFEITRIDANNWMKDFSESAYVAIRKIMIKAILATDMKVHF